MTTTSPHDYDLDDRDYRNRLLSREAYRGPGMRSVTLWLILINVTVYFLDLVLFRKFIGYQVDVSRVTFYMGPLQFWGHFSKFYAIDDWQFWRFITFQFLHGSVYHLAFNMLALYFFGPLVEAYFQPRQFLIYYLLCGVGGALFYLVLLLLGWQIGADWAPLIGASAGIFGVLLAAAIIAPHITVYILGLIPVPLLTMAYFFIIYAVLQVLLKGDNAGGEAAHLGGAAMGVLLMRRPQWLERVAWLGGRAPPF
jgi:membrane associated rhomboid family serine protease